MAISRTAAILMGGIPVLGSVTSLVYTKIAEKFGHRFTPMGPQNYALIATIGLVQNTAALILGAIITDEDGEVNLKSLSKDFFVAHLITGAFLFGLTTLAARVNLIARGLSLPGTALLIVTGFAGTLLAFGAAHLSTSSSKNW